MEKRVKTRKIKILVIFITNSSDICEIGIWSKIDSKSEKISNFMKILKKLKNVEN